ncbi:DUF5977 domain-containing protein, partial [Candidatus Symbiothrix dinenymphae]|uniref:DUF5977 domain-containing protein n=1 Tax=Candidatus Symbiothrix dinenymphae TaxID=467085 RepID=UPI001872550A
MNKVITSIAMLLFMCSTALAQSYSGGDGTAADPYRISSNADMVALATAVNGGTGYYGKHFRLTANLTGITTVIGNVRPSNVSAFKGTFDGGGHEVAVNIDMTASDVRYAGLFGYLDSAVVKNLGVSGTVQGGEKQMEVGGICGNARRSNISECYSTCSVVVSTTPGYADNYAGGICGFCSDSTSIRNCYNVGTVSAVGTKSIVGGICGNLNGNGTISNCYNVGNIVANTAANTVANTAGGILGKFYWIENSVSNCMTAKSNITASANQYGRIASILQYVASSTSVSSTLTVTSCYASQDVLVNGSQVTSSDNTSKDGATTTLSNFQTQSWISTNLGWDFTNVWVMPTTGLPILRKPCYNVAKSGTFTKNNCGTGYAGSSVTYTVSEGRYSSTISQAAADNQAQADVDANGQTYANENGTCTLIPYTITANAGTGIASTSGGGSLNYNATANLSCTFSTGYTFDGWYEGSTKVSGSPNYTFTVTEARTLEARATPNPYTITVSAGTGITSPSGGGSINYDAEADLNCTVSTGYTFDGWYEGSTKVSGSPNYTFTVSGARTLQARATPIPYTITVSAGTGITSPSGGGSINYNATANLNCTVSTGYTFDGWYEGSTKVSGSPNYTFIVTEAITLEARATPIPYTITVSAGTGITSPSGGGSINYNATANLSCAVSTGYTFDGWYEGSTKVSGSENYTFTVSGARTLEARATPIPYPITVSAGTGIASTSGGGNINYDAEADLNCIVSPGYDWDGWYESSTKVSGLQNYTFTVTGARTLQARATPIPYPITYENLQGATNSNPSTYTIESSTIILVNPGGRAYHTFDGWEEGNTIPNGSTGNKTFTAKWVEKIITVTPDEQSKIYGDADPPLTYTPVITSGGGNIADVPITGALTREAGENAGQYIIREGDLNPNDYHIILVEKRFTINPKPVTISGTSAGSKNYDGTTTATITASGTVVGTVGSDDVGVSNGMATFADKNAGTG